MAKKASINPITQWLDSQPQPGSVNYLASALGISRQTLHKWVSGRSSPSRERFELLAKHTGITFDKWRRWQKSQAGRTRKRRGKCASATA